MDTKLAIALLQRSIEEEQEAARTYRNRALQLQSSYPAIARLYLHIAREEDGHALEFTKALTDQPEMKQYLAHTIPAKDSKYLGWVDEPLPSDAL